MSETQMVGSRGAYQYLTQYNSYNYNGYNSKDAIVVHHWGNDGQNFYNVIAALSGTREASAHYVLQDDLVACIISPDFRAWHVARNDFQRVMPGITDVNSHTIGIECRPECTSGDRETLAQLIAELWCDYGKLPVYGHLDFMATACPGRYYNQLDSVVARAEEIYNDIKAGGTGQEEDELMSVFSADEIAYLKQLYADSIKTKPSTWAEADLKKAQEAGITTAERPCDVCSREEAAIMIARATGKLG